MCVRERITLLSVEVEKTVCNSVPYMICNPQNRTNTCFTATDNALKQSNCSVTVNCSCQTAKEIVFLQRL